MTTPARATTRVGLQIPNFTYPGVEPADLFDRVAAIASTAEAHGADTVFVMDHFFQLPMIGPPEHEMFEAYTLLGGLAARTSTTRLSTLVTGVTYRNPAILAKQVTTLDVVSKGRAMLGIGAAWFELEHRALGVEFPPVSERFEHLEDALRICRAMFTEQKSNVSGVHHSIADAFNSPRPVAAGGPPIMVGGQGERKTFRLAAQYADELNTNCTFADLPRKLDALQGHLDALGRPRSDIGVSCLGTLIIGETHDAAEQKLAALLRERGVEDPSTILDDPAARAQLLPRMFVGDRDEVIAQVHDVLALGLDGIVVNQIADGWDLDAVAFGVDALAAAVAAAPSVRP